MAAPCTTLAHPQQGRAKAMKRKKSEAGTLPLGELEIAHCCGCANVVHGAAIQASPLIRKSPLTSPAVQFDQLDSVPLAVIRRQAGASELSRVVPECCGLVWNAVRSRLADSADQVWSLCARTREIESLGPSPESPRAATPPRSRVPLRTAAVASMISRAGRGSLSRGWFQGNGVTGWL